MPLNEKVHEELAAIITKLQVENKLHSREQLETYYARFRDKFGPERIANLDGDELLNSTTSMAGNRESMMYWLEFKNDDEFPDIFGGIGGGNALKFGMFYSQSKAWITGSARAQREMTKAEALDYARAQRDQLVLGCEVLNQHSKATTDDDYRELQRLLAAASPSVVDTSWGHKYFSLLFPDLLDDLHNSNHQRFHLIRMLQEPPTGEGRYICAGRFAAAARELAVPMNGLMSALYERDGFAPYGYWRIGTTAGASGVSVWDEMLAANCASMGWRELGDLSDIAANPDSRQRKDAIKGRIQDTNRAEWFETYASNNVKAGNAARQIDDFIASAKQNDVIVAMDGTTVRGIGRVVGGYRYDPEYSFPHQIPADWYSFDEWRMNPPEGLLSTFRQLGKYASNTLEIERHLLGTSPITVQAPPAIKPPTERVDAVAAPILSPPPPPLTGVPGRVGAVLSRKGQVILYGPPGTGKTYWAEIAARELAARSWFGKEVRTLTPDEAGQIDGEAVRICSFHAAYGYEDFLESYRPELNSGAMVFAPRDGVFKRVCADAVQNPERNYYLIIDEINRGDIPRIFGELLTVLEKNKRGKSVILPLSGMPFSVPPNVYVIGTMNTADRSIALLDAALRRRFGFIELMPETQHFSKVVLNGVPLKPWLEALNAAILENVGRDGRNLQIGHAYFLTDRGPVSTFAELSRIIQDDIIPLLEEYTYEEYALLEKLLGNRLVDVKRQRINEELFDSERSEELTSALISAFPDITTSPEAITAPDMAVDGEPESDEVGDDASEDTEEPEAE